MGGSISMHSENPWDLKKTNIKSEFRVTGDFFSPEEFTQELQVKPDRICKRGEKINHGPRVWEFSTWELCTEYEESLDIEEQLEKVLCKLIDKRDLLRRLKEEMDLHYVFDFAINMKNKRTPGIYFGQEFIDFCRDIGAVIDVDTYIT